MSKTKIYSIKIYCALCGCFLYRYLKEGAGSLIKCYVSGIAEDNTNKDLMCPKCGEQFAREAMVHGRPAHKIIQGKVRVKGHCGR